MAQACSEVVWLLNLLKDFGVQHTKPMSLFCDNQYAVYLTSNSTFHEHTNHIEIDCHTVQEKYLQGVVKPLHIKGALQLTDIFTKALPSTAFNNILGKMGFHTIFHAYLEGA